MNKLYDWLTMLCGLLFLGACGGIERETLTIPTGVLLMVIGAVGAWRFARASDRKEKTALHHQGRPTDKSSIYSVTGSDPDVNPAEGNNHG